LACARICHDDSICWPSKTSAEIDKMVPTVKIRATFGGECAAESSYFAAK
jgi:hypothetical protein